VPVVLVWAEAKVIVKDPIEIRARINSSIRRGMETISLKWSENRDQMPSDPSDI
jgi:hypothetical protein